ncbi:hypothetical protein SPPR111872_05830 [Sphingobacterium prati]
MFKTLHKRPNSESIGSKKVGLFPFSYLLVIGAKKPFSRNGKGFFALV